MLILISLTIIIILLPKNTDSNTQIQTQDNDFSNGYTEDIKEKHKPEPDIDSPIHKQNGTVFPPDEQKQKRDFFVSVVIDDAGYNMHQLELFLKLDLDLTIAVLPGLTYSEAAVKRIERSGKEVMLHFPMEAENGNDIGPGGISRKMQEHELLETIENNLKSISGAKGINNHMGSAATADKRTMDLFFKAISDKDIFFLDSRTTAKTVSKEFAQKYHVPYIERTVFIDNHQDSQSMEEEIRKGLSVAREKGWAVLIGHVWSTDLPRILEKVLVKQDIRDNVVPLSEIITKVGEYN